MEGSRTTELIGWTIKAEWKKVTSRTRTSNTFCEVKRMWEDLECVGEISSNSSGDRTAQWAHKLKLMMILLKRWNITNHTTAYSKLPHVKLLVQLSMLCHLTIVC